ncbi:ASCIZ zinc finger protein [Tachypleus tridentatus]|uniref:ASCIZ zinc finger protein n=1 Tax=Tachypleus tridentatus TaxID=6853 RepID=UPI003FD14E4A
MINRRQLITQFHCQVSGCIYEEGSTRYFKSKKLLNQHFEKVHQEKKFPCPKCDKKFATETLLRNHEKTCGINWRCSCGIHYKFREALLTHARRQQHALPDDVQPKKRRISYMKQPLQIHLHQTVMPIIMVLPDQQKPFNSPGLSSSVKHRKILPKTQSLLSETTILKPTCVNTTAQEIEIVSSVQANSSCSCRSNANKSIQKSTVNLKNQLGLLENSCKIVGQEDVILENENYDMIQPQMLHSKSNVTEKKGSPLVKDISHFKISQVNKAATCTQTSQEKAVAETQTTGPCLLSLSLNNAHLETARESRASQCSPRLSRKMRRQQVLKESAETQTMESTVVKMKKLRKGRFTGNFKSRRSSTHKIPRETQTYSSKTNITQENEYNNQVMWKNLHDMLFGQQNRNSNTWCDMMARSSSGTQTSPCILPNKEFCDSETITEEDLIREVVQAYTQDEQMSYSLNLNSHFDCSSFGGKQTLCSTIDSAKSLDEQIIPLLEIDPSLQDNSQTTISPFPNDMNDSVINMNTTPTAVVLKKINSGSSTNEDFENFLLDQSLVQQSVQTDFCSSQLFSEAEIQTQTPWNFDFTYMFDHTHTQTSEDLTFSDFELSDIETQTPWDHLSNLEESVFLMEQHSIEIQTDPTCTFPTLIPNNNDDQIEQYLSNEGFYIGDDETSNIHLTDTETQTVSNLFETSMTTSWTQTHNLNFNITNSFLGSVL